MRASSELSNKHQQIKTRLPAVRANHKTLIHDSSKDPYQFMTPQKQPMRQQLLSQLNKQSIDLQSSAYAHRPHSKMGLHDQLRALQNPETVTKTGSVRSLAAKSFKGRHLRNGIQIIDSN